MVEKIPIESLDAPELELYRTMRWQDEHRKAGVFVAEGEKVTRRLLESSLRVVSVLSPEKWFEELRGILEARPEKIKAYVAEKATLEKLTGYSMYQGVLAVGRVPAAASLDEMLSTRRTGAALLVAVEGVSNAENMGGLVRNCAAFGADGLLVGETSCSPYLRRAVRSSMGTIFKVPVLETTSLLGVARQLKGAGVRCVAAHPHTNQRRIGQVDLSGAMCLVLGAEGAGLSQELLEACDEAVVIPMAQGVDSLNVGAAGAVFLYETVRQRTKM
jgi:tRNA G18 (ribose-2'-O)-methylase SpoU